MGRKKFFSKKYIINNTWEGYKSASRFLKLKNTFKFLFSGINYFKRYKFIYNPILLHAPGTLANKYKHFSGLKRIKKSKLNSIFFQSYFNLKSMSVLKKLFFLICPSFSSFFIKIIYFFSYEKYLQLL